MISLTHLHVMVIHFPIALLYVAFFSELLGLALKKSFFTDAAFYLLLLGTLGTIVSYLSGGYAADGIENGVLGKSIGMHEEAAIISLWLAITTAVAYTAIVLFKYQQKWTKFLIVILFGSLIVSITRTAYLGGQLVYKHGAGVEIPSPVIKSSDSKLNQ